MVIGHIGVNSKHPTNWKFTSHLDGPIFFAYEQGIFPLILGSDPCLGKQFPEPGYGHVPLPLLKAVEHPLPELPMSSRIYFASLEISWWQIAL